MYILLESWRVWWLKSLLISTCIYTASPLSSESSGIYILILINITIHKIPSGSLVFTFLGIRNLPTAFPVGTGQVTAKNKLSTLSTKSENPFHLAVESDPMRESFEVEDSSFRPTATVLSRLDRMARSAKGFSLWPQ
jgi:hypothetical protein